MITGWQRPDLRDSVGPELRSRVLRAHLWWRWELRDVCKRIWVFGSTARGEASEQSDVDLLVDTRWSPATLAPVSERLSLLTGRSVHVVAASGITDETDPCFVPSLLRDAVALHRRHCDVASAIDRERDDRPPTP